MLTDGYWRPVKPHLPRSTARTGRPLANAASRYRRPNSSCRPDTRGGQFPARRSLVADRVPLLQPLRRDGAIDRLARTILAHVGAARLVDWSLLCVHGANVTAHARAAGGRRGRHQVPPRALRSRRPAQRGRERRAAARAAIPREAVRSRPSGRRGRHPAVVGDKGYGRRRVHDYLRRRGIRAVVPRRPDRVGRQGPPSAFDHAAYCRRNAVDPCVGWLEHHRLVGTRHEKLAVTYVTRS